MSLLTTDFVIRRLPKLASALATTGGRAGWRIRRSPRWQRDGAEGDGGQVLLGRSGCASRPARDKRDRSVGHPSAALPPWARSCTTGAGALSSRRR